MTAPLANRERTSFGSPKTARRLFRVERNSRNFSFESSQRSCVRCKSMRIKKRSSQSLAPPKKRQKVKASSPDEPLHSVEMEYQRELARFEDNLRSCKHGVVDDKGKAEKSSVGNRSGRFCAIAKAVWNHVRGACASRRRAGPAESERENIDFLNFGSE
jgi:hypothetical protein